MFLVRLLPRPSVTTYTAYSILSIKCKTSHAEFYKKKLLMSPTNDLIL